MIRNISFGLIGLVFVLSGCERGEKAPEGTKAMTQLIQAGQSPVEIGTPQRSIGPVPAFNMSLRNISDKNIDIITWTVVLRKADGSLFGEPSESGFSEAGGLKPGESMTGAFPAGSSDAAKATVVIKEVTYTDKIKEYEINKVWKNPKYEAELKSATSKS
jgi:hypothetical protein